MKITWRGHSCFVLESGGFRLMLDPYKDVPGLADISGEVNAVLCSHQHADHNYTDRLTLTGGQTPFVCTPIPVFHDDQQGSLRGPNTIHCLTAEQLRVVHLGDLGHLLGESELALIRGCDVLCLPVGGTFTIDSTQAWQLAEQIAPRVLLPMHYHDGLHSFPVLEPVEHFLAHVPAERICRYPGDTLTVTADTPPQVALLTLPNA